MKRAGKRGLCCGAGGAQMWKEDEPGDKRINMERTEEALGTGAEIIAVNCPFCLTMMSDGVKGKEKGDVNSSKYYGNTGTGLGGNYNLAGRKALSKPKEQPDCQEEGIVVVRIQVNKNGRVINAIPGVKGSTNTAACLLKPAKLAALKTKWNSDSKAPSKQTGTIIYKFSLSK